MLVTEKGQVTIPKHIRTTSGVLPGSEVSFSLDSSKIIITAVAAAVRNDRRANLAVAAARVRSSLSPKFKQLGATEIMDFLRSPLSHEPPDPLPKVQSQPQSQSQPAVASGSLARYDGSAGVLVDTSIWIDCIDSNSVWHHWAIDQLQACGERSALHVNPIIFTELLVPGPDVATLDALLDDHGTLRSPLPWSCCALAAKAFGLYRTRGGAKLLPLPHFLI